MRVLVVGAGAVGARAARQLVSTDEVERVLVADADARRAGAVVNALGHDAAATAALDAESCAAADVVVLATPGDHRRAAQLAIEHDADVVSVTDAPATARQLLDLGPEARERGRRVIVGAGFSPGLTCVLARHGSDGMDEVDEVHVAKVGTGGPSCARQHHRALGDVAVDWRDGSWAHRPGGSGRELVWFPDPIGAVDCYRAGLADALLLAPSFPHARRITARLGASRRDRLTAWLPMLRPPHPEGGAGAVRVEVRGRQGATRATRVLGAVDRPSVAAGAVAAVTAWWAAAARLDEPGAGGLSSFTLDTAGFLGELARRGVKAAVFEGA